MFMLRRYATHAIKVLLAEIDRREVRMNFFRISYKKIKNNF